jgi:hypothetical protein
VLTYRFFLLYLFLYLYYNHKQQQQRTTDGGLNIDMLQVLNTGRAQVSPSDAKANIHNMSWGQGGDPGISNTYDIWCRVIDSYAHYNDEWLAVVAAGNHGAFNTFESVQTPAVAKNVVAGECVCGVLLYCCVFVCVYIYLYSKHVQYPCPSVR